MTLKEYAKQKERKGIGLFAYAYLCAVEDGYADTIAISFVTNMAKADGVNIENDLPPWECCEPVEHHEEPIAQNEKSQRIREIEQYTAYPKDGCVKKQLKGFLHKDSIEEKERIFDVLHPIIAELRAKQNYDTESERDFFFAYTRRRLYSGLYLQEYKLIPQAQINGTVAKYKPYRADFLNHATKTIIEINGGIHNQRRAYDRERTEKLNELGYTVVVFTNEEIAENADACADEVLKIISRRISKGVVG